jgi:L-ascorbate metabolism protein UlaG (beta-lactamase superfamily)
MTVDEAVEALKLIQPQVAIPMHIGRGIGELDMAEQLKQNTSVSVKILPVEG